MQALQTSLQQQLERSILQLSPSLVLAFIPRHDEPNIWPALQLLSAQVQVALPIAPLPKPLQASKPSLLRFAPWPKHSPLPPLSRLKEHPMFCYHPPFATYFYTGGEQLGLARRSLPPASEERGMTAWRDFCGGNGPILCLLPALGFSADGQRLGRGKAYYDCFLAHVEAELGREPFAAQWLNWGVCYDFQILPAASWPCQAWDYPVQSLISNAGHLRCSEL